MDAEVLGALSGDDLVQLFAKMGEADGAAWAAKVSLVQEIMRREEWKSDGSTNAAEWVAWRLDVGVGSARQLCRVARDLRALPALSRALGDGVVCWAKVVALSRFVTPQQDEVWAKDAAGLSVETIEAIARRRWAVDHRKKSSEGDEPARNRLEFREDHTGDDAAVDFWGRMVGDDAARFKLGIESIAKNECRAAPGEEMDPWPVRQGDALALMLTNHLGGLNRDRATVNVHIAADNRDGGLDVSMMPGDFPLTAPVLERLLCDCRIRLIYDDESGAPVGWTDAQPPPPALEQAVLRRDVHCVIRGCRAKHGQIHHIVWRSRNGKTTYANLVFVCWRHHRMIHDLGWQLTGTADALTWSRPDGTVVFSTGPPRLAA
jgi:hypothetical protein